MKNKNFEDLTEKDLLDVNLSKHQKDKIKRKIDKILKEVKFINKELNIDISTQDMLKIKEEFDKDIVEFGVKNANVYKKIVLDAIDNEIKDLNIEIIDELFITTTIAIPGRVNIVQLNDATYFYKMYLTKDELIVYSLNDRYKITKKKNIKLKEIKSIGKAPKFNMWAKGNGFMANFYNGDSSFIEPKDKEIMYLNHMYKKYEKDAFRFLDKLSEVSNIELKTENNLDFLDKVALIINISILVLFVITTIRFIIGFI